MGRWLPATEARLTFLNHAKEALGNPRGLFSFSISHFWLSISRFPFLDFRQIARFLDRMVFRWVWLLLSRFSGRGFPLEIRA
jgi:hypothetical protein